jgi:hypothetical protein
MSIESPSAAVRAAAQKTFTFERFQSAGRGKEISWRDIPAPWLKESGARKWLKGEPLAIDDVREEWLQRTAKYNDADGKRRNYGIQQAGDQSASPAAVAGNQTEQDGKAESVDLEQNPSRWTSFWEKDKGGIPMELSLQAIRFDLEEAAKRLVELQEKVIRITSPGKERGG